MICVALKLSLSNQTPRRVATTGVMYVTVLATKLPASRTLRKFQMYAKPVPSAPKIKIPQIDLLFQGALVIPCISANGANKIALQVTWVAASERGE